MSPPHARLSDALRDRYTIERELGAGGMATVYLARDLKHDRLVAVKVLHPELAAALGAERFLSEIRTTANLQHPHILPLHDSGEANGLLYYVMPYIDGESLRARLEREHQLPLAEVARIGSEVADALAYAHQHGVVHRDIKPENILLQSGHALVADFGIALAVQQAGGTRLTQTGLSLGTPQYMAPEQAMGERAIDHRADIYALGAVLYEGLTGEPPFTGATLQAIVAKVMAERPIPPSRVRDTVPPQVEDAVLRALAKLPADRFNNATEFAAALERDASGIAHQTSLASRTRATWRAVPLPYAGVLLALAGAAGWCSHRVPSAPELPPTRLSVLAPRLRSSGGGAGQRTLAITPDGSTLLFIESWPTGNYPIVQQLHDGSRLLLREADGFGNMVPMADGSSFAALSGPRLARVHVNGGTPTVGADIGAGRFFAAHPDGSIWITRRPYTTMERIPPGGRGDSLDVRFRGLPNLRLYQILDDGRTAILIQFQALDLVGVPYVMDLRSGGWRVLLETRVRDLRYTSGHLVYQTGANELFAVAFDMNSRRATGPPVRLAEGLASGEQGIGRFAVSRNGTVAFIPLGEASLVFVDRRGGERLAFGEARSYHAPTFSPDGRRVAVDITGASGRDVWILDVEPGTLSRATRHGQSAVGGHDPTWTPDGKYVSYTVQEDDSVWSVYRVRAEGGAAEKLFSKKGGRSRGLGFTGRWLPGSSALIPTLDVASNDIAIVRSGGRGSVDELLADSTFREVAPAPSPDGRWLAFASDESGRFEVYVMSLGERARIQVSRDGGTEPAWGRDGELFYIRITSDGAQSELLSARIEGRPALRVRNQQVLFRLEGTVPSVGHAGYDVSPDGNTFVFVRENPAAQIVVIQNLPALVRQLGRLARPQR